MSGDAGGTGAGGGRGGAAALLAEVEREFPGWHVWRSSAGRAWATRTGPDARYGEDNVPMTIDADTVGALRIELAKALGSAA